MYDFFPLKGYTSKTSNSKGYRAGLRKVHKEFSCRFLVSMGMTFSYVHICINTKQLYFSQQFCERADDLQSTSHTAKLVPGEPVSAVMLAENKRLKLFKTQQMSLCAPLWQALQMWRPTGHAHPLRSSLPTTIVVLLRAMKKVLAVAKFLHKLGAGLHSHPHTEASGQRDDGHNHPCL